MASNKPNPKRYEGFRGLKWGTNIKDMNDPNMSLVWTSENERTTGYVRKDDKLSIGKAKLEYIIYYCYKGKFYVAQVEAKGDSNGDRLKEAVFAYYGKGAQPNEFIEEWKWHAWHTDGKIQMSLDYTLFVEETTFGICYMPISKQQTEDNKKAAEEAEDDF